MRTFLSVAAAGIGLLCMLAIGTSVQAADVKVLLSGGFVPVFKELAPRFERATGHQLSFASGTLGVIEKRILQGEDFNVVVSPRLAIDVFVKNGKTHASNVTVIANSLMSVAVRQGAPKPDISSPEALKRALLAAKSVAYSDPENLAGNAALGIHVTKVLAQLGITAEMKSKAVFSNTVDVGDLVENGDAELGISQQQSLMRYKGISVVGPLPGELQYQITFAAAIMGGAGDTGAPQALVDFLRTPEAAAVIKSHGMQPVRQP